MIRNCDFSLCSIFNMHALMYTVIAVESASSFIIILIDTKWEEKNVKSAAAIWFDDSVERKMCYIQLHEVLKSVLKIFEGKQILN